MRPITLIAALIASLHLWSSSACATWFWPVRGPVLTPYRNGADPYAGGQHRGVDIGAPVGRRVVAAVDGTITFAGVVGSSGLTVSERTGDGRFDLSYLHLSNVAVKRGDQITAGAAIGAVGLSGRRSVAAPHLHFGVREAGSRSAYRDPLDFLGVPAPREVPRAAPSPVPVPVIPPASPATAPTPTAPSRRLPRVPHPGLRRPLRAANGVPRPHPASHSAPAHSDAPRARPVPLPRGPGSVVHDVRSHPATAPGHRSSAEHGGINVGWLIACVALLAAATALGNPGAARKMACRGRARVVGALRPAARRG